jgi:hypothetical protein
MVAPVRPCSPRPDAPSRQLPAARRIGTRSGASSADLGPHWVLVRTDAHGRGRSPAVAEGSEESQVAAGPAQAAGRMRAGDSDCGPKGGVRVPSVTLDHFGSSPAVSPLLVGVVDHLYLQVGVDPDDLAAESSTACSGSRAATVAGYQTLRSPWPASLWRSCLGRFVAHQ